MFTGIIEDLGVVESLKREDTNLHLTIKSTLASELKIDQSVSHNGVCLTVVDLTPSSYTVTAIKETLRQNHPQQLKSWCNCKLRTRAKTWCTIGWSYGTRTCRSGGKVYWC